MKEIASKKVTKGIIKPIVMIGLMGAGKSRIGRELASKYGLAFIDTDDEIVKAAGCSVSDIFKQYGERAFRDVEERVISRLLTDEPRIIATGGGAFMNKKIRKLITKKATSIWLKAELDVLIKRTALRSDRPLLEKGNPERILKTLMIERYPFYSKADIVVDSLDVTVESTVKAAAIAFEKFQNL